MKRAEQIFSLKRRYHKLTQARQWKAAERVWVRLFGLMNAQLKWETNHP